MRRLVSGRIFAVFFAAAAAVIIAFTAGFALSLKFQGPPPLHEVWKAGEGPPPGKFVYLMFPRDGAVQVTNPDGTPWGVLDRAMNNLQEEIDAGGNVQVAGTNGGVVPLDQLLYLVDDPPRATLVAAWYASLLSRGVGDRATLTTTPSGTGTLCTVHVRFIVASRVHKSETWECDYLVDAGRVTPLAARHTDNDRELSDTLGLAGRNALLAAAGGAGLVVGAFVLLAWLNRDKPGSGGIPPELPGRRGEVP